MEREWRERADGQEGKEGENLPTFASWQLYYLFPMNLPLSLPFLIILFFLDYSIKSYHFGLHPRNQSLGPKFHDITIPKIDLIPHLVGNSHFTLFFKFEFLCQ
jgi:hypothetical protein